jgi:hypothetical protein
MDDESTQAVEETQAAPAETPAAESQVVEQTPAESGEGQEPQKPAEAPASTGAQKPSPQEVKPENKPQSRRSAAFRIQELVRENNELKKQVAPKEEADEFGNPAEEKPDEKYAKLEAEIEQLKGLVKPVMTNSQRAADDAELSELFTGERAVEKSKYEEPIRKMWELSQYKDTSAADLYKIVAFDDAVKAATEKAIAEYKEAEKQAKESSASGTNSGKNRTGKTEKTAWDMTDEEFKAATDKARASG